MHLQAKIKLTATIVFTLFACDFFAPNGSTQTKVETAGQKFKSIKVLNDMPVDQMGKVMNLVSASLGVNCNFCHVGDDFEKDGKKYGIDQKYIHLGKFSIPTAVLAMLPINQQANPTSYDRNKLSNQMHADIFWQAQRGMNDADFKKAVRSIRERKEREKAQAEKKTRQADQPAAQSNDR